MEKQERLDLVYKLSDDVLCVVIQPNTGHYWNTRNCGYKPDISDARKFTRKDIINMLTVNGLIDKTILVFTHTQTI